MKALLILLLTIGTTTGWCQGKCKFEKNEVDPFTQTKDMLTEWSRFNSTLNTQGSIKLRYSSEGYLLYFSAMFGTNLPGTMSVEMGQELTVLLANGDTVVSHANETVVGTTASDPNGITTKYRSNFHNNYRLSSQQIVKLKSAQLKAIRVACKLPNNSAFNCDFGTNKKEVDALIEMITCIETN